MKVTLVQPTLHWENREENLKHLQELISDLSGKQDLIVLPEMFTTGFTMNPEKLAEAADGVTLNWLKKNAITLNSIITGSVAVEENGRYYNRLYWARPDGSFEHYNKRHLFRMAGEHEHYTAGTKKLITEVNGWKFCPMVCYDLRFPVWSRNRFKLSTPDKTNDSTGNWDYDVLMYVANWPDVRSYQWQQLLIARAIENQCYVIGVNRVGKDGNGYAHSGKSVVINPKGEVITDIPANEECVKTLELDFNYLKEFRKIFPVGMDADPFELS